MFEAMAAERVDQHADAFTQALLEAPPRPRRSEPQDRAEQFCERLAGPGSGSEGLGSSPPPAAEPEAVGEPEPGWGATVGASFGDRAAPVSPQVAALQEAIAAVAAIDPSQLDGAQALADATALLQATGALRLAAVARVADVEDRKLHRLDDAPTTNSWLRQHESGLIAADVTVARRLPKLPTLSAAVADGSIGMTSAGRIAAQLVKLRRWLDRLDGFIDGQPAVQALHGVIVNGVRQEVCQGYGGLTDDDPRLAALMTQLEQIEQRPDSQIARVEAAFVLLAQHLEPELLPGALAMLVDALLPNELERRAADAHANRGFGIRPDFDGSGWHVTDGDLDLELGELLHTVLTAMRAVDEDNVADTDAYRTARADGWSSADGAEGLTGPDRTHPDSTGSRPAPRSRRQRQHDALKSALRLLLDSGILGLRDKMAPHVSVGVGIETLHREPGAAPATGASGARLPLSLIHSWWCDSSISRFVLSLGRKVIETSHTERTLKAHERRAKHLETGGRCQVAGCRCGPGSKLIPHHPDPWCRSGTTSKDDTTMLCESDHTHLHNGGTLRLRDRRLLGPDGWIQP